MSTVTLSFQFTDVGGKKTSLKTQENARTSSLIEMKTNTERWRSIQQHWALHEGLTRSGAIVQKHLSNIEF